MSIDLATVGAPIAAQLLPGWKVTWEACTQEQLDELLPRSLAVCTPTPTRSIAHVRVLTPWPASESLSETLWHELTHALISPLTSLLEHSAGAVMVEEQIVERLGVLLSTLPLAARRAVVRAIDKDAPRLRARISARAPLARDGGQMDPEKIKALIAAIKEQDGEAALQIAEAMLVEAASGQPAPATAQAGEPDGDEAAKVGQPPSAAGDGGAKPPTDGARVVARKGVAQVDDPETIKARKVASLAADELKAMADGQRGAAKEFLIVRLRARLGAGLTPAAEKQIMGAATYQDAEALATFAEAMGGTGPQRARSGVGPISAPEMTGKAAPWTVEQLVGEGIPQALAEEALEQHRTPGIGPKLAQQTVQMARARLQGGANPYMPKPAANGAQKVS